MSDRVNSGAAAQFGARVRIVAAGLTVLTLAATSAHAAVFPAIPDLTPYSIVSVGPNASLTINSGPNTGLVLVGDGSSVTTSGGGNGSVGGVVADTTTLLNAFGGLQTPPTAAQKTLVSPTVTGNAFTEAANLQTFLDGLTATQTYGALSGGSSLFTGNGGLNVITFTSLQNQTLTLSGTSSDIFVLRTAGNVNTNQTMSLTGGVTANHIIWDLQGTSGNIFQTSGGDLLYGTFLSTRGGDFQFSNLALTGQLINTGGHIQLVSGSAVTGQPFVPPSVPEPATWAMLLAGFFGVGSMLRARRNSKLTPTPTAP